MKLIPKIKAMQKLINPSKTLFELGDFNPFHFVYFIFDLFIISTIIWTFNLLD